MLSGGCQRNPLAGGGLLPGTPVINVEGRTPQRLVWGAGGRGGGLHREPLNAISGQRKGGARGSAVSLGAPSWQLGVLLGVWGPLVRCHAQGLILSGSRLHRECPALEGGPFVFLSFPLAEASTPAYASSFTSPQHSARPKYAPPHQGCTHKMGEPPPPT